MRYLTSSDLKDLRAVHHRLVRRGVHPHAASAALARAASRVRGSGMGCGCDCCPNCTGNGLGDAATPSTVPIQGAPSILANLNAAGDDPSIVAARGVVSKWSWLIPVGGLLMSAKAKISSALGKGDPAVMVRGSRRR